MDVSFASFLCAKEKEGKVGLILNNKRKKVFFFVLFLFIRTFGFAEGTFARKNKEKQAFLWFFPRLIVPLQRFIINQRY